MRLLNTFTLEVEEFLQSEVPEYVILSHFWQEEEVTLSDIQSGTASSKLGYTKLESCAKQACEDGFTYCWIDTFCIDKASSAELSEALNSMYQWYQNARICYAYLADFEINADDIDATYQSFAKSRWFTRGWTLQELIAPVVVEFYSRDWVEFGTRLSLQDRLAEITGITKFVLRGGDPSFCEVAVRMSWAANRRTSRVEDEAYCLMGLFSVNMPLLYGEGTRAFRRLQEEILRVDEDYTLFAWYPKRRTRLDDAQSLASKGLFAKSPQDFSDFVLDADISLKELQHTLSTWTREDMSKDCTPVFSPPSDYVPPHLTSRGLRIMLPLFEYAPREYYMCLTIITPSANEVYLLCLTLICPVTNAKEKRYIRDGTAVLKVVSRALSRRFKYASIYIDQPLDDPSWLSSSQQSWPNTYIPPFLLINVSPTLSQHQKFSGLTNLQRLLEAWLCSIGQDPDSQSAENKILDSIYDKYNHNPQFEAFVEMLAEKNHDELVALSMGDMRTCYLADSDPAHNVIGFTFNHADTGFWVHVSLGDKPSCELIPTDSSNLAIPRLETGARPWTIQQGRSALQRTDRATILVHRTAADAVSSPSPSLHPLQITVSVRRIASARDAGDHARYMLSLKESTALPRETLTRAMHRPADEILAHSDSGQQISRTGTHVSRSRDA